jgi:hypothetical protein
VADTREQFVLEARRLLDSPPDRAPLRAFAEMHDWDGIARRFVEVATRDGT